jgi:hypothetical protein
MVVGFTASLVVDRNAEYRLQSRLSAVSEGESWWRVAKDDDYACTIAHRSSRADGAGSRDTFDCIAECALTFPPLRWHSSYQPKR